MFLMYTDESGDPGIPGQTPVFVLTGLVIHELRWHDCLTELVAFRRWCRVRYGLKLREEIHAGRMFSHPGSLKRIKRHERLAIVHAYAKKLAGLDYINLINVVVTKAGKPGSYDVFDMAWRALIQRFENTMNHRNFRGPVNPDDRGMLFPDHSSDAKLQRVLRQMRHYNPVPSMLGPGYRNLTLARAVEDPNFRDSAHSYLIQSCDLAAFLLYQNITPSGFIRKKGARNYFDILDPVLCKVASTSNAKGIVKL